MVDFIVLYESRSQRYESTVRIENVCQRYEYGVKRVAAAQWLAKEWQMVEVPPEEHRRCI